MEPVFLNAAGTEIVDGRNRCDAAELANIPVKFERLSPDVDEVGFIISKNLLRRHLTTSQRAVIANELANLQRGGDAGKPKVRPTAPPLPLDDRSDEVAAPKPNSSDSEAVVGGKGLPVGGKDPVGKARAPRAKVRKSPQKAEPQRPDTGSNSQVEPLVSQRKAADRMKVSVSSLKKVKAVGDDPILKPALAAGTVSVDAAYKTRDADDDIKRRLVSGERVAARTVTAADSDGTTPEHIMSTVRRLLDCVDLDPASSIEAQKSIKAVRFLTPKEDALKPATSWGKPKEGVHVFLHPPRGEKAPRFASRLLQELESGAVGKACWLGPAAFEELWFRKLVRKSMAFVTLNESLGTSGTDVLICFRVSPKDVHEAVGGWGLVSTLFRPSSSVAGGVPQESAQVHRKPSTKVSK